MVKITNGLQTFEVTEGAFDSIYKPMGFTKVNEGEVKEAIAEEPVKEPEKSEDEIFVEEILEKPIAQWSGKEVKKFAEIKGIDISGTKNANEAKDIIKEFLA